MGESPLFGVTPWSFFFQAVSQHHRLVELWPNFTARGALRKMPPGNADVSKSIQGIDRKTWLNEPFMDLFRGQVEFPAKNRVTLASFLPLSKPKLSVISCHKKTSDEPLGVAVQSLFGQ